MRKVLLYVMLCIMSVLMALTAVGCDCKGANSGESGEENLPPQQEITLSLKLQSNSIIMFVGETYTLDVKKVDSTGKEESIKKIEYSTDSALIASVDNGVITAKAVGNTYINVTADGMETACFVEVKEGVRGEKFEIRLVSDKLYNGIPIQAYVYLIENGTIKGIVDSVTFTAADPNTLDVQSNGQIKALKLSESTVIKASGTYNGQAFSLEKTVSVISPFIYRANHTSVLLASATTYSGKPNDKFISAAITIERLDAVTGEKTILPDDTYQIGEQAELFKSEIIDDKIIITAKANKTGKDGIIVNILGTTDSCYVEVNVYNAIATIDDMDKLAIASLVAVGDLAKNYILVNDIDYGGKAVYPIASFKEGGSAKRYAGYQWKYALDKTDDNTYVAVARDKVGQEGYGLTDDEFLSFAKAGGINTNKTFSGTFDGNGFTIKNAKYMYGAFYAGNANAGYYPIDTGVFSWVQNATIRNLSVDISMQTPEDVGLDLSKVYDGDVTKEKLSTCFLRTKNEKYVFSNAALVVRSYGCTIENVRISADYSGFTSDSQTSVVVHGHDRNTSVVQNVVVETNSASFAVSNSGTVKVYNSLAIGSKNLQKNKDATFIGTDGNWYIKDIDWKKLFSTGKGSAVTNVVDLADTILTFDTSIWDMTKFNATDGESPQLINGCSVPKI